MEISCKKAKPHPQLLDALFAFRSKVSSVFRDVLGLHEINHIAVSRVNPSQEILIFSSTPALEFNLFSNQLWRYDQSYSHQWFEQNRQANWQSLYDPERYDELYYLKQIKHHYPLGYSLAARQDDNQFIYSFASNQANEHIEALYLEQLDDYYKIGQYCANLLDPLFLAYESMAINSLEKAG